MEPVPGFGLYRELEVDPKASPAVIAAAYKALALKVHPDVAGPANRSAQRMKRVNLAYEWLSDPVRRAHYDSTLKPAKPRRGRTADATAVRQEPRPQNRPEPSPPPPPTAPNTSPGIVRRLLDEHPQAVAVIALSVVVAFVITPGAVGALLKALAFGAGMLIAVVVIAAAFLGRSHV